MKLPSIFGNPVRPEEFSAFLRRERQALARRRIHLSNNISPRNDIQGDQIILTKLICQNMIQSICGFNN